VGEVARQAPAYAEETFADKSKQAAGKNLREEVPPLELATMSCNPGDPHQRLREFKSN